MFVRYPIGISNTTTPVLNTLYSSDIFNNSKVLSILSPVLFAYERTGLDCPDCPRENLGSKGHCLWKIHIITELCRIVSPIKCYFRILFDSFLRFNSRLEGSSLEDIFPSLQGLPIKVLSEFLSISVLHLSVLIWYVSGRTLISTSDSFRNRSIPAYFHDLPLEELYS